MDLDIGTAEELIEEWRRDPRLADRQGIDDPHRTAGLEVPDPSDPGTGEVHLGILCISRSKVVLN